MQATPPAAAHLPAAASAEAHLQYSTEGSRSAKLSVESGFLCRPRGGDKIEGNRETCKDSRLVDSPREKARSWSLHSDARTKAQAVSGISLVYNN